MRSAGREKRILEAISAVRAKALDTVTGPRIGAELRLPTALAILLAVLVIRPQGLFGHVVVRRV